MYIEITCLKCWGKKERKKNSAYYSSKSVFYRYLHQVVKVNLCAGKKRDTLQKSIGLKHNFLLTE